MPPSSDSAAPGLRDLVKEKVKANDTDGSGYNLQPMHINDSRLLDPGEARAKHSDNGKSN